MTTREYTSYVIMRKTDDGWIEIREINSGHFDPVTFDITNTALNEANKYLYFYRDPEGDNKVSSLDMAEYMNALRWKNSEYKIVARHHTHSWADKD